MSLSHFCSEICKEQKHKEKFTELQNDENRLKYVYEICKNYISNLTFKRVVKNNEKSAALLLRAVDTCRKNQNWEALTIMTECIAFAEEKQFLVSGYKGRSDILLSLNCYREASCDILAALNLSDDDKPPEEKVASNNEKRAAQATTHYIGSGSTVGLIKETGSHLESASKSVGLKYSDYYERQLVARNDIKTGEILIVEKPYASVLLPSHFYTHCSNCFTRCFNLLPCKGCCFSMFCSKQCETQSLKNYHKIECSIMDILTDLKVERMELLSLRILICASKQGKCLQKLFEQAQKNETMNNSNSSDNNISVNRTYKSSDFMNIYNLVTNLGKRQISDLLYRCIVSAVLVHLLSKHTNFFSFVPKREKEFYEVFCTGLIYRFMQSLPCNAHEISELTCTDLSEIGAGIYATLSLINHSCDPNVVRYCCRDTIVLRAIKPIKKDDQILDNYGYHYATHSLSERQTSLLKQYHFKCECEACTKHWPEYHNLPHEKVRLKKNADVKLYTKLTQKFQENLRNTLEGNFNSETVQELTKYLDHLHESVHLPWQNFNNCQEAIKHCWSFEGNHFRKSKAIIS